MPGHSTQHAGWLARFNADDRAGFLGSTVPVVVYVSPTGATATSAGCFITLAANVAAMAPATTIGAAHPVMLGGIPSGHEQNPTTR